MIGRSLNRAMSRMMRSVNAPATAATPVEKNINFSSSGTFGRHEECDR